MGKDEYRPQFSDVSEGIKKDESNIVDNSTVDVINKNELAEYVTDTCSKFQSELGQHGKNEEGKDFLDATFSEIAAQIQNLNSDEITNRFNAALNNASIVGQEIDYTSFNITTIYAIACYALYGKHFYPPDRLEFEHFVNVKMGYEEIKLPVELPEPINNFEYNYNTKNRLRVSDVVRMIIGYL